MSAAVGIALAVRLVIEPLVRARREMARAAEVMHLLADAGRRDSVGDLLRSGPQDVRHLSKAVHAVAAATRRDQLEASRLRREMEHLVASETRRATAELSRLTITDELTGLGNRRHLEAVLPRLYEELARSGGEMSMLAIDLDHFKRVNDTLGHDAGDRLLVVLGQLLKGQFRQSQLAVRTGGDEFLVALPGSDRSEATGMAERLSRLFSQHPDVRMLNPPRPTLSVGVASLRSDRAGDVWDLVKRADRALYEAKRAGRGRVSGEPLAA
ncbi:MAG: GGDEF domain-containing protein [Phycisphaerae bacterium]|nr:GGDEF domain-containing protein [Phycisphaerae bacterium]